MEISEQLVKELISNANVEREALGRIINPIASQHTLSKKEFLEVCQIGKFVHKIGSDITIVEKPAPPKPDFIIQHESKFIGLEHTRIFTENAENYNRTKSIIEYSEEVYKELYPEDKVHGIISIFNDNLIYKQNQKRKIATEIAQYVKSVHSNILIEKPNYIETVRTTIHSKISFSYKEKKWESRYLTKERLEQEIRRKESRLEIYKKDEIELSEYWLVLMIGSLTSASYELDENLNYETASCFDRVYLMADFEGKIIRVQ